MNNPSTPQASSSEQSEKLRPLFRKEAIDFQGSRQYGTVTLAHSVSHSVLAILFALIAASIVGFFFFFGTIRKAQCQGVLLPTGGVVRVVSSQPGVISTRNAIEGQFVHAGDVLFVLSGERVTPTGGATQETVSRLMNERRRSYIVEMSQSTAQAAHRIASGKRRIADLAKEIEQIGSQVELQQRRTALSEEALHRFADLKATNFISAAQLQEKQADVLDQQQRLGDLQRLRSISRRDLESVTAEVKDQTAQAEREEAGLRRNASAIEQDLAENEARRQIAVRAPNDGLVTAITATTGQTVAQGATLASVLPAHGNLEAEIYVPSRSVGFVKAGMTVLLRYQAYPYQKFGQHQAVVREVANTSLRPDELGVPGSPFSTSSEPLYRIRLTLDEQSVKAYGKEMPLKSGMLVDASILLESRRLYEWVLEPLFSITGRI